MSKRTDREFLSDILEAIRRIKVYMGGMSYEAFLEDINSGCGSSQPGDHRRGDEGFV